MFSNKKIKYLVIAVVALIIFAIIGKKTGLFGSEKPIEVAVETPKKRTIYAIVTANGKVQPETEVKISADVSGEIVEMYIKEGETVTQGQALLKIKPDIYLSAKDRAKATVNNMLANLENSKARLSQVEAQFTRTRLTFERNKKLHEQKTISDAEWEAANAEYEIAKADVEAAKQNVRAAEYGVKSAEASLTEADQKLVKTIVYAPMSGLVTRLVVEKGERVVGTEMMTGSELLRIADMKRMEVKVDVNENDILRVKKGDTAIVEVDAYLEKKFKGIVTEIANSASSSSQSTADQVTSFEVKIILIENSYADLVKPDNLYPFRPGMTASVDIQADKKINAISVPVEAVVAKTDSALYKTKPQKVSETKDKKDNDKTLNNAVFIINKNYTKAVKVKTGIQDNNYIEITEGLKGDEQVIVAPYSAITRKLKDSTAVKVVDKKNLFMEK